MTDLERRRSMDLRSFSISQLVNFAIGLVVLVLGALTMAFALVRIVAGTVIMFSNTDPAFQLLFGFVTVIVGSMIMPGNRRTYQR